MTGVQTCALPICVEQTSDRFVAMAQALSGGDATKADEMIAAIKKGYEQASKAWGDKLPDICQRTIDAATKKLEAWRDSLSKNETETEKDSETKTEE